MRLLLAALLLLAPPAARADTDHGGFTKHKTESFFAVTAEKRFSIEFELEGNKLKVGGNRGELVIHDSNDRDVKGARITVTPWMPDMGHGVPEVPVVKENEGLFGSRYLVENLQINMGGRWEILVEVEKDGVADGAVFEFPDVGGKGGAMTHGMSQKRARPAELDLAARRATMKAAFTVEYRTDPSPPPMNRIHSWTLTVTDASGSPVTGAKIKVDGGMPEHGHGLPTAPEVTDETAPGSYLVEGVKFSMPGWWEMTFHISAGGREDMATFNLLLK